MEEMKRVALENVSHFLFIQEPRGQTKACIKRGRYQGYSRLRELFYNSKKTSRGRRLKFGKERKKESEGRNILM